MRNFSRLPLYFLFFLLITLYLGVFIVPVRADNTGFLSLINTYRQQNNLGILAEDQNLTSAACWLSADLDKNGFNHTDSLGRDTFTRLDSFGVSGGTRGENIFYTTVGSDANFAFVGWKNSPGHNANMLETSYTRIGIGRVNVSGKWYWTTDFASGTAIALTSQCGSSANPPPPPAKNPPAPKNPTPPPIPVPLIVNTPPSTEVVVATPPATETNLKIATKPATISAKIIKIEQNLPKPGSSREEIVKGSFLTVSLFGYLILFGFIFWRLFHHFHLPTIEHEEI